MWVLWLILLGVVAPLADLVGGMDGAFKLVSDAFIKANHGLKYADVQKKGFVAIKATKVSSMPYANIPSSDKDKINSFVFLTY